MSMPRTLVLVHGFMGSALNWGPILTRLKKDPRLQGWHFVSPDLLGHGGRKTGLSYQKLNHRLLCNDLKQQIPEGDFIALGHSFGLRPLLGLSQDPDLGPRMKALIVEDASPEITQENYFKLKGIIDRVPVPFLNREEAKKSISTLFSKDPRLAAFLFSNIRPQENGEHSWRFDKEGLIHLLEEAHTQPLWQEWSKYPNDVFMIYGENSDHVNSKRLNEAIKRRGALPLQTIQIAQSGHWIHSEQPEAFTEELVKILTKMDSK
jgi:esterase